MKYTNQEIIDWSNIKFSRLILWDLWDRQEGELLLVMRSWVWDGQVEEDICYKQMNISLIHNRENLIVNFFLHQVLARLEEEEDINEVHKLCKIFWKVADMRLYFV